MASALLHVAVPSLSALVVQELKILIGIGGQVEWIEKELRLMQSSLEHVEAKEEAGEEEKKWASEAREIFQKVEEVIDIFLSKSARYRRRRRTRGGAFVILPLLMLNHLLDRIRLRMKIDNIQADIRRVGSGTGRSPTRLLVMQEEEKGGGSSSTAELSSQEAPHQISAARTLVISVIGKIDETINENLLVHSGVIEGIVRMREKFTHILMMINDATIIIFNDFKQVHARKEVWMRDLINVSKFTEDILKSFANRRLKQVGKGGSFFKFPLFFLKDLKLGERMEWIDERIQRLYNRNWRYGIIGAFEKEEERQKPASSSSSMVPLFTALIIKEAASWLRVGDQLESIRTELELMQALLKDVGTMEGLLDRRIEVWLKLMKEILDNDGKELLDKNIHKAEQEKTRRSGIFRKACSSFKKVAARPTIATTIRRFNNSLVNLSERKRTYDIGKIEAREQEVEYSGQQQQQAVTTVSSTTPEDAFHENQMSEVVQDTNHSQQE